MLSFISGNFDQCSATQECHAIGTGHYTPPRDSIQTQGRTVLVLSIDVEPHTGIHKYPFQCLGLDPPRYSSPYTSECSRPWSRTFIVIVFFKHLSIQVYYDFFHTYTIFCPLPKHLRNPMDSISYTLSVCKGHKLSGIFLLEYVDMTK